MAGFGAAALGTRHSVEVSLAQPHIPGTPMNDLDAELQRTAYQKKAVSKLPPAEVLAFAVAFFGERGYRAGRTGRPGQVFVMGKGEGLLPRVTGEVAAR